MKAAVRTIARWETTRPPKGKVLNDLRILASDDHQWELAQMFSDALADELGSGHQDERAFHTAIDDIGHHLDLARDATLVDDHVKTIAMLEYVIEETNKLRREHTLMMLPTSAPAPTISESVSDEQDRPGEIYDLIEEKIAQHPGMPYMVAHDEVRHENTELWERAGRELALRRVAGEKQEATRESESDEPAPGREVISGDSARKNKRSVKK
jgi:hypothetical protein